MAAAYTDKEIDEIAAWLKEGLSASRIAGRFSALRGSPVSRNAIIGIVHRNAESTPARSGRAGGPGWRLVRSRCPNRQRFHGMPN